MQKSVCKKLIFLFATACALIAFACVSVSKFVLTDKKELVGVYTDFVLSHDGDGKTAVIKTETNDSVAGYKGYIVVTVSNFTADKVSKRDVKFTLRVPTAEELESGFVTDAWKNKHSLAAESKYYDVSIVDENDEELTESSNATLLKSDKKNSSSLMLKIKRKAAGTGVPAMPAEGTEYLSVILQTSEPYRDLQVFTVNTTMARLSVGVSADEYRGYERKTVNLKSSAEFVRSPDLPITTASYLATVEFTLQGNVIFDYARYAEAYGDVPAYDPANNKYTITVRPGADVNLYFYVGKQCKVTVSATVADGKTAPGTERVSGVTDNVVFKNGNA